MADMQKLAALAGMTSETDAENPDPAEQQQQAEQAARDTEADAGAKAWGMMMFTVGGFAQMLAPELKPVYSEERCFQWGQQAQAVAEKHGWNGPSAMPELALIASTAGFAVPTYLVIRGKVEQAKAAKDGTLLEKVGAWWQHMRAKRAAGKQAASGPAGEVVGEAHPGPAS